MLLVHVVAGYGVMLDLWVICVPVKGVFIRVTFLCRICKLCKYLLNVVYDFLTTSVVQRHYLGVLNGDVSGSILDAILD